LAWCGEAHIEDDLGDSLKYPLRGGETKPFAIENNMGELRRTVKRVPERLKQ
jgi:hypothetical protein